MDRFKGRTSEDVSDGWNERIAVNSGRPRGVRFIDIHSQNVSFNALDMF